MLPLNSPIVKFLVFINASNHLGPMIAIDLLPPLLFVALWAWGGERAVNDPWLLWMSKHLALLSFTLLETHCWCALLCQLHPAITRNNSYLLAVSCPFLSTIGGPVEKMWFFQMAPIPLLSVLIWSTRCQYYILKVSLKKIDQNLPIGCVKHWIFPR